MSKSCKDELEVLDCKMRYQNVKSKIKGLRLDFKLESFS